MKELEWLGDSKEKLKTFPEDARRDIGYALDFAQRGLKHPSSKPFKNVGAGVFEIVENCKTNTYRAVYAVKIGDVIYVLHSFKKKSKVGIKTPKNDVDIIKQRYKLAKIKGAIK